MTWTSHSTIRFLLQTLAILLFTATVLGPPTLRAQEIGDWIDVPSNKPHPRIFFDRDEIPAVRKFAQNNEAVQPLVEDILETARAWVDREIDLPDETVSGLDEPRNQAWKFHNTIQTPTKKLALAYIITGDEAFARKAAEILRKYADKYRTYGYAGTPDVKEPTSANVGRLDYHALGESSFAKDFALTYDLIAGAGVLTEQEKTYIEEDLLRELYKSVNASRLWNEGGKPNEWPNDSNHGSHRNEAIAIVGYALGDEVMVNSAITGPLGLLMQTQTMYYEGYLDEESPGYHFYALSGHLGIAEATLNNGVDLYQTIPAFKDMFDVPRYLAMPDGSLPAIGDAPRDPLPTGDYALAWLRYGEDRYADVFDGTDVFDSRSNLYLLFERFDPADVPQPDGQTVTSKNFEEAGMGILRSGGRDSLYTLLLYGPHGGNHGHRDKLSVLFHANGQMLGYDEKPEYRIHWRNDWFRQTFAHNTVTVDQTWQLPSRGESEGFLTTPVLKLASASADSAYRGVTHARNVIMVQDRYIIMVDVLEAGQKRTFDWVYRSPGAFTRKYPVNELNYGNLEPYRAAGGQLALMEDIRESERLDGWKAIWKRDDVALHLTMPEGQPRSKVFSGSSPRYAHDGEQAQEDGLIWDLPMVFARRTGTSAVFVTVLEPVRSGESPASSIEVESATFPVKVSLSWPDGTMDEVTLSSPRDITTAGRKLKDDVMQNAGQTAPSGRMIADGSNTNKLKRPTVDSRVQLIRRKNGEVVAIAGLDAQRIEAGDVSMTFKPHTNSSLRRTESGWRLAHDGPAGTQITLSDVFEGASIRKIDAERDLITTQDQGEQTFVLEDNRTYIIDSSR